VALLLENGANVNAIDNIGMTPLIAASAVDDPAVIRKLVAAGADVHHVAVTSQPGTALMAAAANGNVEIVRLLLSHKPNIDAASADLGGVVKNGRVQFGRISALHLATVAHQDAVVNVLLEAGASVDVRDVRGMTPLMFAIATDRPDIKTIRALVAAGADLNAKSFTNETAVDWARKFNHPAVLRELKLSPAAAVGTSATASSPRLVNAPLPTAQVAVTRSLPLLRSASARVLSDGGCVACHAQPVTAMASKFAERRGWIAAGPDTALTQARANLNSNIPLLLQGRIGGGSPDIQVYTGMMLAAHNEPPSLATDALAHYLAARQQAGGNWHGVGGTRAPMQDGDFSRTAMAIRVLATYAPPARQAEFSQRVTRAAAWLAAEPPLSTEDRVMQLLGLTWAKATGRARETRARELIALQRPDGGWAQTPYLASDAYATGQAMFALRESGASVPAAVYRRGTDYLLRTQAADGSWHVVNRAMKIQPYFESGFPYGHDQWISQTATAWAAMALTIADATAPPAGAVTAAR
jgi:hypothetical protein